MARRALGDIMDAEADIDRQKLDATTEEDIRRYKAEDGYDFMPAHPARAVLPPGEIRKRLGMTQEQFAHALRIPVGTLRNWEQGRVMPDPAGRSLLNAVARSPRAVLEALRSGHPDPATDSIGNDELV